MRKGIEQMLDARSLIGTHDALFITLDTLRYDVARDALDEGRTPNLAAMLPDGAWEERHSPGNFTYAAHHAFFAGFLPTPISPGPHPRLFAAQFEDSETTAPQTCVFDAPDIVTGLAQRGYHTVCIGGVGFSTNRTRSAACSRASSPKAIGVRDSAWPTHARPRIRRD